MAHEIEARGSSPLPSIAAPQLLLPGLGASSLFEGPGRLLIDEIAEALSAVIELED